MKKGLKKFSITITVVLAIVTGIDCCTGFLMDWMLPQISNQGATGKTYFSFNEANYQTIIVGSSRAEHHYVTQLIEDSIGMPTYNVGRDGCFFNYNCCLVNSILDRYTPKAIIWEFDNDKLYSGIYDPLEDMYPYYRKNKWITSTIEEELPWSEYVRLNSNIYRYNSILLSITARYLNRSSAADTSKGYAPLYATAKNMSLDTATTPDSDISITKFKRFEATLKRIKEKGVTLILVDSPKFLIDKEKTQADQLMEKLCSDYSITYIDNSQIPMFLEHPEYYKDQTHLNDKGAKLYTEIFISQCKSLIK